MKPALVPDRLLRRRLRVLLRHLPQAAAGSPRAVHRARVASRRLREALPVGGAHAGDRAVRRTRRVVRRITRALGGVRELDVADAVLGAHARRRRPPAAATGPVRAWILGERAARQRRLADRLDRVDVGKLARRIEALQGEASGGTAAVWRRALAGRLTRRLLALRAAVEAASTMYLPDRLHDVRLAVKKLRYALEVAEELGAEPAVELRALRQVQATLGRLHDVEVLAAVIGRLQAQAAPPPGAAAGLEALAQALEQECRELHARYVAHRTRLLQTCDRVAAAIVPALDPAARRRRVLRMAWPETARPAARRRA